REMALQSRFERRSHGEAIEHALNVSLTADIFIKTMVPEPGSPRRATGFFFLTVCRPPFETTYDEYREYRAGLTQLYAQAILMRHSHLERVVAIACEPMGRGQGSSEDILYAEQSDWTDEQREEVQDACRKVGIMRPGTKEVRWGGQEFPNVDIGAP